MAGVSVVGIALAGIALAGITVERLAPIKNYCCGFRGRLNEAEKKVRKPGSFLLGVS